MPKIDGAAADTKGSEIDEQRDLTLMSLEILESTVLLEFLLLFVTGKRAPKAAPNLDSLAAPAQRFFLCQSWLIHPPIDLRTHCSRFPTPRGHQGRGLARR